MPVENDPIRQKSKEPELPGLKGNTEKTVAQKALEKMQGQILGKPSSDASLKRNNVELAYADKPAEKAVNKPLDKPAENVVKNLKLTDEMRNATGAYVQKDTLGRTALIVRKDNTTVEPHWEGNTNKLIGFDESHLGSDQKRSWTRDGDAFKYTGPDGRQHALKNVEIDKNNNGNFSFTFTRPGANGKPNDTSLIVRGNGAQILKDENGPVHTFDSEGRLSTFQPTMDNYKVGESSLSFSYIGKTSQVSEIAEIKSGKTITEKHLPKPGEELVDNGNSWDLKYPETIKMGNTDYPITRVHRLGSSPALDDRQKEFPSKDGSKSITHFGANGSFVSVDAYSKEGKLLKTYAIASAKEVEETNKASGNKPEMQIAQLRKEIDHVNGNTTLWGSKDGTSWFGKQVKENGKDVSIDKEVRYKLDFDNLGELKYIDKTGALHTEFKDGKSEVLRFSPNDTYTISDNSGNILKAGYRLKDAGSQPGGPDLKNYIAYKYETKDGKSVVTEANFVQKGETLKDKAWTPEMGKDAAVLPNGELRYLKNDKEKVVIKPDQSTSTFLIGKDASTDLLTEVRFPDGSKRNFEYGNPPDKRHPIKIESSFKNPNGDTVVIKTETRAKALTNAVKTRLNDMSQWTQNDFISVMQGWSTTGTIISKDGGRDGTTNFAKTDADKQHIKLEKAFALELLDNGNYELTPTSSESKDRVEFPAARMADFPLGRPLAREMQEERLRKAGKYNTDAYMRHVFPKDMETMDASQEMQLTAGEEPTVVETEALSNYLSSTNPTIIKAANHLALKHMAKELKQTIKRAIPPDPRSVPPDELVKIKRDMAYALEKSGAIIEGIAELKAKNNKTK